MRRAALALLALLLSACSTTEDTAAPPNELTDFEPGAEVREVWSADTGWGGTEKWVRLAPFADGGMIYAANHGGDVSGWTLEAGDHTWTADLEAELTAGVGGDPDTLYVGTAEGEVVALEREDGAERWREDVSGELLAPPAGGGGRVIVRTVDGRLIALDADDGGRIWSWTADVPSLSLRGNGAPLRVPGGILVGLDDGQLAALSESNGQPLWQATIAEPTGRSPVERMVDIDGAIGLGRNVAYAATYQGEIAQIEPQRGNIQWSRAMSSYAGLGVDRSRVYVSTAESHVVALGQDNGDTFWRQEKLAHRRLTAPVPVPGTPFLAVGDYDGYVHILTRADGRIVARERIGWDGIMADPLPVAERRIAVQTQGDDLAILEIREPEED
jgi:outer membrane protein assembly factor BamB